ncbi:hypothetical protein C5D66_15105 [Rathayibacter sp. AY1B4]|nr:hypothetical protein C5D66_15105 [Rathayibacter sp. AY1B4]
MTATMTTASGETIRASTRSTGGVTQQVVLWTKRVSIALTADEARSLGVSLLDQALRAERATDDAWPDEVPC